MVVVAALMRPMHATAEVADKLADGLKLKDAAAAAPAAAAVLVDEPVAPVDEAAIQKAYDALVAEDGRYGASASCNGHAR